VLDLQMGVGSVGNMAAISALRIQTDTVPEPATASIVGAAGLMLGMRWRRA
jgi:proteasome assembly chaperone (PAC2) family protein